MPVHPNSIANLTPWQPGTQPKASATWIERTIARAHKAAPQAMRLIAQAMKDPELPMSTRLRCAEYIVDKTWPKPPAGALASALAEGAEWLELRFVSPSGQASSAHKIEQDQSLTIEHEDLGHASDHPDVEPEDEPSL